MPVMIFGSGSLGGMDLRSDAIFVIIDLLVRGGLELSMRRLRLNRIKSEASK